MTGARDRSLGDSANEGLNKSVGSTGDGVAVVDENQPLLSQLEPRGGFWSGVRSGARSVLESCGIIKPITDLPLVSSQDFAQRSVPPAAVPADSDNKTTSSKIKTGVLWTVSALQAATPALNGIVNPTHSHVDNIVESAWWNALSREKLFHGLLNGAATLGVNILMSVYYLPEALKTLYDNIKDLFLNFTVVKLIKNFFSFSLSTGSALAASAITFEAFVWLEKLSDKPWAKMLAKVSSGFLSSLAFLVAWATRYVGTMGIINKLLNSVNPDQQTQTDFVRVINQLSDRDRQNVQVEYEKIRDEQMQGRTEMTPDDLRQILIKLAPHLEAKIDLLPEASRLEWAGFIFDVVFAVVLMGIPAGMISMQKGFDGAKQLAAFGGKDISDMNPDLKRSLGGPSLVSAFGLYANSGLALRAVLIEAFMHIWHHPSDSAEAKKQLFSKTAQLIVLLVACGLSGGGFEAVAHGVLKNPNNILNLPTSVDHLSPELNMGAVFVNTVGAIKWWMNAHAPLKEVPKTLQDLAGNLSSPRQGLVVNRKVGKEIRAAGAGLFDRSKKLSAEIKQSRQSLSQLSRIN